MGKNEVNYSSHSTWRCQYHIVFAPKFRRKVIYGQLKADIGQILRKLCEEKKVEIIEAEACVDHIHMLVSIGLVQTTTSVVVMIVWDFSYSPFGKDCTY